MVFSSRLLICDECDTVHRMPKLGRAEVARCARCGAVLARRHRLGLDALMAMVLAALFLFIQGNIWPVVTLGLNGQQNSTTLWGMILIMWQDHSQVVSVITAVTLFFFPLFNMLSLGWLLSFGRHGRAAPGFRPLMLLLHYVGPWTMSEVFVLGALVAMVKAKSYFEVFPDAGIYAYGALILFTTLFAGFDLRRLWDIVPSRGA